MNNPQVKEYFSREITLSAYIRKWGKSQVSDLCLHLNIFEKLIQSKQREIKITAEINQNTVKPTEKTDETKDFSLKRLIKFITF